MSYKKGGFPYYSFNPIGFRSRGSKPPFFSDLIQWACGNPVTVDGETYIQDKKNNSGVAQGRDEVLGPYFNGNGSRNVLLPVSYISEIPSGDYISIESELEIPTTISSASTIFSTKDGASEGIQLRIETTKQARILISNTALVLDSSIMSDGRHIVELRIHSNGLHEFYIDGSIDTSVTNIGAIGQYNFGKNQWFSRDGAEASVLKHYTAKLMKNSTSGKLQTYFQSTNSDTKVQFFNRTTGEVVIGEIQNATLNDLVSTTDYPSDMNDNGYTEARALEKNLFNGDLAQFGFFVDSNGDIQSSGSANWLSSPILVEPNTEYTVKSISNMGRGVSYDEDGNKIGLIFDQLPSSDTKTFATQSNAKTIVFHIQTSTTENVQLELGNTPTTYEPWVGYYYDSALTLPVPDGTLGYNVNGKTTFFTAASTPEYASSEFVGGLKADIKLVPGKTYNGKNNSNWQTTAPAQVTINPDFIRFEGDNSVNPADLYEVKNIVAGQTYTSILLILDSNSVSANPMSIGGAGIADSSSVFANSNTVGYKFATWTAENPIVANFIRLSMQSGVPSGQYVDCHYVGTWEGTITDISQVNLTEFVDGNSWIQHTRRYDLIQADKLTTTEQYDQTDADNVFALPVEITTNLEDNPLYVRVDPWCLLQYNRTLTTEENEKVDKYLGFSAPLLDGAGNFLLDGADDQIRGTAL